MGATRVLGVIPARLGSERLPRKPLYPLAGGPLIEWVWRRVRSFGVLHDVVVATDSSEVLEVCRAFGAAAELTSAAHHSGTERIAELVERAGYRDYDVVVNVQGDEPFVTEEQVAAAVAQVEAGHDIGTVATPVRTLARWRDPAVVKVVRGDDGRALYFSRAPIPHRRGGDPGADELGSERFLRHVGLYAYAARTLKQWRTLPPSELERTEKLEQLRALAAGLSIGVAIVSDAREAVDTPEQARRAETELIAMAQRGNPLAARAP